MKNRMVVLSILLVSSLPFGIPRLFAKTPDAQASETAVAKTDSGLSAKERLGKLLFFETSLSTPPGQACSTCHAPERGFTNPDAELPVSKGVRPGRYGNRNDLTAAYAAFAPPLHQDEEGAWVGGLFWDGRANTLAEQAKGPPLNPLEMAAPDIPAVVDKLRLSTYTSLFHEVYGPDALATAEVAFDHMADAIQAFEKTSEVSPFSSKYDHWLEGKATLSEQELRGMKVFEKGNCAVCHPNRKDKNGAPPLFTTFTYDNLGVPRNPENPFYALPAELNPSGTAFIDLGLGQTVKDPAQNGKFRTPTLRNVAVTGPYMHNGVFKTLFQVCAFYNTRDVASWPAPEIAQGVNHIDFGNLKQTNEELEDLVAFLRTLTDGWMPPKPDTTK